MKYLSVFFLVTIMVCTWKTSQSKSDIPFDVHATIQSELETFIKDYITSELPSAKDIRFNRIWTEELADHRLKATFEYSFSDSAATDTPKATLGGVAILSRNPSENDVDAGWGLDEVQINNEVIEFKERDVPPNEGAVLEESSPTKNGDHQRDQKPSVAPGESHH